MNDSFLSQVSDSNLSRNRLPVSIEMIIRRHLRGADGCILWLRCSGSMAAPWSARNKAWCRGYACASPLSRPFFELNFENGRGRVALISKAVASSFSYRREGEKKERKEGVTSYPRASALQKPRSILETGYLYLNNRGAFLCSGSLPVCLSDVKRRQKKWDKGFVITSLWSQVPFVKENNKK